MFKVKIKPRRIVTVGGTLLCAWATGYLMQSGARDTVAQEQRAPVPEVEVEPLALEDGAPLKLSGITMTSALSLPAAPALAPAPLPARRVTLATYVSDAPIAAMPGEETSPTFACDTSVTATPADAAMVTLHINTPCRGNDRFTVHHNGMMFSDVTDDSGKRILSVPALAADAVFIISFAGGGGAVATARVPAQQDYDRVIVQWTGDSGLQISAQDPGADRHDGAVTARYGTPGGTPGAMAEVYSFSTGQAPSDLTLEAEVTAANCGRDIEAQIIRTGPDGPMIVRDVTLAMPDCSATGDFLVLKNLLNDLKIARN